MVWPYRTMLKFRFTACCRFSSSSVLRSFSAMLRIRFSASCIRPSSLAGGNGSLFVSLYGFLDLAQDLPDSFLPLLQVVPRFLIGFLGRFPAFFQSLFEGFLFFAAAPFRLDPRSLIYDFLQPLQPFRVQVVKRSGGHASSSLAKIVALSLPPGPHPLRQGLCLQRPLRQSCSYAPVLPSAGRRSPRLARSSPRFPGCGLRSVGESQLPQPWLR